MFQYDPTTEFQIQRLRQQEMNERLARIRLVRDAGVTEPSLPARLLHRVGRYVSQLEGRTQRNEARAA